MNRHQRRALEAHNRRLNHVFSLMDIDPNKAVAEARKIQPPEKLPTGPMEDRTILAGLHKARVASSIATHDQAEESRSWLRANGFREGIREWRR